MTQPPRTSLRGLLALRGVPTVWRRLAQWRLSPGRMRALALLSALATGLVLWAGLSREGSGRLAAAAAYHRKMLADAAATAAQQPAASPIEQSAGGNEASSEPTSTPQAAKSETPTEPKAHSEEPASTVPGQTTTTPVSSVPTTGAAPVKAKIGHVFVIALASPGYEQTWGTGSPARYLTTQLRPKGTLLSHYYAIAHPDLPNYIAMISGQPPNAQTSAGCLTFTEFPPGSKADAQGRLQAPGCVYPVSVLTLGDQLTSAGLQWRGYIEDLANGPKPVQSCRHPISGQPDETQQARPSDAYATRHNPFVYFHSLLDLGDCTSDDVPLTQLSADLAATTKTPNYALIAPNLCHDGSEAPCLDGSPGGLAAADAFLAEWVPKILASPAYRRDGLLVITFANAPANDTSGCCTRPATDPVTGGGRVGALLISRYATAGGESTTSYNHYSLLRTIEDIFGLSHLANAGQPDVKPFSSDALKRAFARTGK